MKEVQIKAKEFRYLLWPAIVQAKADNVAELELAVRLIKKLKASSVELSDDSGMSEDNLTVNARMLEGDVALIQLEEDEHKFLLQKLKNGSAGVSLGLAEDYFAMIGSVEKAKAPVPPSDASETEEA
jgi:hypothetical protein